MRQPALVFASVCLLSEPCNYWPHNHARWLLLSNDVYDVYQCVEDTYFYIYKTIKIWLLSCLRKQKGPASESTCWPESLCEVCMF